MKRKKKVNINQLEYLLAEQYYHLTESEEKQIMANPFQEIDVHGMNKTQAFSAIEAVLRRAKGDVYTIRVIHGYHSGTILRDAIRSRYHDHPKVKRIELGMNPGETDLILREL